MARPQMRGPRPQRHEGRKAQQKSEKDAQTPYEIYSEGLRRTVCGRTDLHSSVGCGKRAGSMFLKSLIDDYISPLLLQASPVFTGLLHALMSMAVIYLIGIATTFVYNWLMVSISQGVLKKVRDEMFAHMQKLPIRYFDTHTHGDLMSISPTIPIRCSRCSASPCRRCFPQR